MVAQALDRAGHGCNGCGLVFLDRDDTTHGTRSTPQDECAEHDVARGGAHQRVVTADPGLALRAVQHERVRTEVARGDQLGRGRKAGAAEPGDTSLAQSLDEYLRTERGGICDGPYAVVDPVRAVAFDHDADAATALDSGLARLDCDDDAGERRVHGRCERVASARDERAPGHGLAHDHYRFGAVPRALIKCEHQVRWRRQFDDPCAARLLLVCVERKAGGERGSGGHHAARGGRYRCDKAGAGRSEMQSTGQGGRQSSQPVHCVVITVCICLGAPTMASTGQTGRQRAQPMHFASSIHATCAGFVAPKAGSGERGERSSNAASARTVTSPPGGQRSISAAPLAIAAA